MSAGYHMSMETPRDFKADFKQLLRHTIVPLLKAAGFEARGQQSFRRPVGEVFQYLGYEGNRTNGKDSFAFTGNVSFQHVAPATLADFWCDDPAMWIAGMRMGYLTHGRDHWYRLEDHGPQALAAMMAHDLAQIVLPRLATVATASDAKALMLTRDPDRAPVKQ